MKRWEAAQTPTSACVNSTFWEELVAEVGICQLPQRQQRCFLQLGVWNLKWHCASSASEGRKSLSPGLLWSYLRMPERTWWLHGCFLLTHPSSTFLSLGFITILWICMGGFVLFDPLPNPVATLWRGEGKSEFVVCPTFLPVTNSYVTPTAACRHHSFLKRRMMHGSCELYTPEWRMH